MYVCLCNGYRESDLRDVARDGIAAAGDAYAALGKRFGSQLRASDLASIAYLPWRQEFLRIQNLAGLELLTKKVTFGEWD